MIITEKLRNKILLHLPKRYAETIAEECGCHVNTVYNVLHHGREKDSVAEALIRLAEKTKQEKKAKEQKQKRLAKIAEQL